MRVLSLVTLSAALALSLLATQANSFMSAEEPLTTNDNYELLDDEVEVPVPADVFESFSGPLDPYSAYNQLKQCPRLQPRKQAPADIHDLRIDDIKVIMALGDSLSAGFAVKGLRINPIADVYENRGLSWIMGGDKDASTVANFFGQYQPNIVGRSVGDHIAEICYGILCPPLQYRPKHDVFNAAQSGAIVANLEHELKYLVPEVKKNKKVDFKNDWKLMSIAIGPNDLCLGCFDSKELFLGPDKFEHYLREVVDKAHKEFPRTIVALTELFNVSQVFDLSLKSTYCRNIHRSFAIECSCAFNESPAGTKTRAKMDLLAQQYNERMRKIAADYSAKKLKDFAVVVQPMFREADAADFPVEFLSKVDCFHISQLGAEAMAVAYFNNLFVPLDRKRTEFNIDDPIICPNEDMRIETQ